LNVPFADKDHAKALGAQWHADQKLWVVPAGRDLTPFASWLS
jgi:putative DNA primase/helicase